MIVYRKRVILKFPHLLLKNRIIYLKPIFSIFHNMEKRKLSVPPQLQLSLDCPALPQHSQQPPYLLTLIPKPISTKFSSPNQSPYENMFACINNLHTHQKIEELGPLFQELGADVGVWLGKATPEDKGEYLWGMLDRSVQDGLKKVNGQASPYISLITNNRKAQRCQKFQTQKQKPSEFDWLTLNTKNEMLKSKLKTKLVQTINEFKNQSRLRKAMDEGTPLQEGKKISLEDQSIELYQDGESKMTYQWTAEDQALFLENIRAFKEKFVKTEFLKNCHRYKFITYSELKTLAAEEISRKLDKSNKAFLSREFLLDKYFSTKENLTQKQIKFILKTSPLLSKCVDKSFVRAAIKNIHYEDIDKMELKIAEQIIEKFEMIRNLVKNSRKMYKQKQNNKVKKRIQIFEREKQAEVVRANMNEKLNHHKTKMIRNLNYRPSTAKTSTNWQKNKENFDSIYEEGKLSKKMVWPIPLNNNHPATGLFIKDCSEQLNEQFNEYQKGYLKNIFLSEQPNSTKKSVQAKAAMMKFYTGGPKDSGSQNRGFGFTSNGFGNFVNGKSKVDKGVVKAVCEAFKTIQYRKDLLQKLNSFDLIDYEEDESFSDKKTFSLGKSTIDFCLMNEPTKRTKKAVQQEEPSQGKAQKIPNSTQKVIKDKIIQGRQKAKMKVYVKKLQSLAAENAFLSLKALNAKFTPSQINSLDPKGNTALFYATKHKNSDFIDYLLAQKADVNIRCSKGATPLHNAFRSSNYAIICKCLSGPVQPNLNALDDEGKTPLAYCCRKVLEMLGLEQGVVSVAPGQKLKFNNTSLLCLTGQSNQANIELQLKFDLKQKKTSKDLLPC